MNTYRYTFIAACPGNGEQIIYSLELRHTQKVLVEHIKTACALHKQGHQEDIAADLHTRFGGHLTLRAVHHGLDIETVLAAPAQAQEDARDAELFRALHWATTLMEDPAGDAYQAALIAEAEKVHDELGGKMENNTIDQYRRILKAGLDAARAAQGGA